MVAELEVPALTVRAATKYYDSVAALDGIDITLGTVELLALVGPSGCGKSTLLRSIAGLEHLDEGSIAISGTTVDDSRRRLPPEKRHVGLVFQDHSLFPHLSVADNVAFGIRDSTRRDVRDRVAAALEVVELATYGDRFPHELSGGERQRAALARALAPEPSLMLLDEPFANLDPNLRGQLRSHVAAALVRTGTPAIFVTHDQQEALALGDRVAVMRSGRIEHLASPAEVFHKPQNRFVGAFMGEASFLEISDRGEGSHTFLGPVNTKPHTNVDLVAMVRPDDITFVADVEGNARMAAIEFRGGSWACTIELDDGELLLSTRSHLEPVVVGQRGRVELSPGHHQVPVPRKPM